MWRNYLTVGLRALTKNRTYAFITIIGLASGLAACLIILNYVNYERSYDSWLPDSSRIYQVQSIRHEPGQRITRSQNSPFPVRDTLPAAFPEIEAITVLRTGQSVLTRDGKPLFVDHATVDPAFFKVFKLAFVHGSAADALPNPNAIVLTESEALKQFGTSDAVGRTVILGAGPGKRPFVVSGVLRDLPKNSNLRLAILHPYNPAEFDRMPSASRGWGAMGQQHYVKLHPGTDAAAINAAIPAWEKRVIAPQITDGKPSPQALDIRLAAISSLHLGEFQQDALRPGGDPRALAAFAVVALLTLAMAIMNFVNLSTARATLRAREVALRKVLGARRAQLITQFLGESVLLTSVAMLLALAMVELATPWVGQWVGADLRMAYLGERGILLPAAILFVATGLAGGLYPAFYLSRFQPAAVLRANKSNAETVGDGRFRTALVVLQFAGAIGLLVCTSIIYSQARFVEVVDPGYRRNGLIQIDSAWRFAGNGSEYAAAYAELLKIPGVAGAGRTNLGMAATNKDLHVVRVPGEPADLSVGFYRVDPGFFDTMELRLLSGRALGERFSQDRRPETTIGGASPEELAGLRIRGLNVVVNRNAASLFGFATPQAAVGKSIKVGVEGLDLVPAMIVGVVEDTRIRTARDAIEPIVYSYDPQHTSQVIIRYAGARSGDVMAGIEKVWRRFEPEIPFEGRFAEDIVREVYVADRARGALFAVFALLAVVIACLGLFGLAAYTAERRTKEIGIRKVLGARTRDIVRLLAWQFSKPVIIANLIAWPVAWWLMRDWLNGFDTRIALGPTYFILAGALALVIAIVTIAGHAIKVARANPIHALRYE